jgi:hypothetical protein
VQHCLVGSEMCIRDRLFLLSRNNLALQELYPFAAR